MMLYHFVPFSSIGLNSPARLPALDIDTEREVRKGSFMEKKVREAPRSKAKKTNLAKTTDVGELGIKPGTHN